MQNVALQIAEDVLWQYIIVVYRNMLSSEERAPMKMAIHKLLSKIPFTSKPGLEEMLTNDDFTKYTQDDLDRFEEVLIQNSEDKCKDMIRSYFKVLSSLAKRGGGSGFFGRVASAFRRILHNKSDATQKYEESITALSKKRKRRSSAGVSKRIKRDDPTSCKTDVAVENTTWVNGMNIRANRTIQEGTENGFEHAHPVPDSGTRRQRRKISYGYCPEDLVGKPISPDLFTRALNPEYNFLPGLPKLVLGDIPTDEEDEYFRKKEYMNSFSDEYGEKCNFNDGKPYNCRRCVEKEYIDKMEGLGLLGCDAGLLDVVIDRGHVRNDDRKGDDAHSLQEKRRKIEGKYYVDWVIKADTPSAEHSLRCKSSMEAQGTNSKENAAHGELDKANAVMSERSSTGDSVEGVDGDNKGTVISGDLDKAKAAIAKSPFTGHLLDRTCEETKNVALDAVVSTENIQHSSKSTEEENTRVFGSSEGYTSKTTEVVLESNGDHKNHRVDASLATRTLHASQSDVLYSSNRYIETTLDSEFSKKQVEQEVSSLSSSADASKTETGVPHMLIPESPSESSKGTLFTKENAISGDASANSADKNMIQNVDVQQVRVGLPQDLQSTIETHTVKKLPSIPMPYCWSSATATYKVNTEEQFPAKKRDLQTMQSRSNTVGSSIFASQKDHQTPVPFSYTDKSAMPKVSSFLSNTGTVKTLSSPSGNMNTEPESTHSAHFPERSHDAIDTGLQKASIFANLFEANTPSAANNQPLMPQGNLFGSPSGESSRLNREGQDVASRFNRRKR